ncbi:uncharacterized protein LOC125667376 [Ostrea edulis]|uniref:uncharacterized protein LOC125667376 n=1 Tax=Ostrea edulis TaxID=37623 RepID=UPI0024AF0886|nr:uncharacterized protein LOC125667376 [Ostrea edulis]
MFKIRGDLCAFDRDNWNRDKEKFDCPSATNVYHCIVDERNRSGEICIQPVWVQTGYCPEYNTDANTVDTVPCDQSAGCPEDPFQSNEVYQYPVCINKTYHGQPTAEEVDAVYFPLPTAVGISVVVVVAIIFVIAIVCYIRRRQKPGRRQEEEVSLLHRSEVPFFKTSAFHDAVHILQNGGKFLCFHGRWGSGKTTTAKQVYLSVTGRKPVVIEDIAEFDVSSCADCVIVEDPFSKHLSNVEDIMLKIKTLCSNIGNTKDNFAIFTMSDEEWTEVINEIKKILLELGIGPLHDICLNYDSLSPGDRNQILHSIFGHYNPKQAFGKVENIASGNELYLGYAETYTLLSRCRIFQTKPGPLLFSNRPLLYLKMYLERKCKSSEEMERSEFVMLVFMSLNKRTINLNKSNTELNELFMACDISLKNVQLSSIIPEEFVFREGEGVYVLQHDVIQRMVLVVFGTYHFEKLVRFSSWHELPDWIKEKSRLNIISKIMKSVNEIQPILEISHGKMTELRNKCESIPETRVPENSLNMKQ